MARKKKNWDRVRKMQDRDKNEYRDVYEDQQLDRSEIDEKQTMTSRRILIFFFSLFIFVVAYFVLSFVQMGLDNFSDMAGETTETIEEGDGKDDEATDFLDGDLTEHSDPMKGTYFLDSEGKVYRSKDDYAIGKVDPYFHLEEKSDPMIGRYYVDKDGSEYKTHDEYRDANPDLFKDIDAKGNSLVETEPDAEGAEGVEDTEDAGSSGATQSDFTTYLAPVEWKIIVSALIALVVAFMMETIAQRNLAAQNLMSDTSDINQYQNDQHIMLPEEMQRKFDWFPDVGAHSNVQVSSMISHMMLSNKGIKKIELSDRAEKDILDEDGDIEYYEGEVVVDEDGEPITNTTPMFDKQFGEALFDASGMIKDKKMRKYYDPTTIPYNKGNTDREKLKGFDTLADLINKDWIVPSYEPQRPAGAYVVDTAPVNTMVLAITRAGKGQTVIEPTIDMWTRERRPNNMVINDPKGELLVKNYVKGTMRGYQIVQFNLINSIKTDIYDPLGLAADAAREGDFTKCALYVENIADVFFPLDGGEDPVWPNAANNAFKRAAYGLIDYYLEEEKELRSFAEKTNMDEVVLESKIDAMWGKVTLYNCYQLFVQLTSKKLKNPAIEFTKKAKAGEYDDLTDEEYEIKLQEVTVQAGLWEDRPETDLLTLYFNATDKLPRNSMRTLVSNVNNALKAMAGAEKMMASVYGIAITAMSFFTDPTISTLTSGTPSQNVDLAGLSFPRRLGVRFHSDFITRYHLIGSQAVWDSFEDKEFTKLMGDEFHHEDLISREGWAKYYFKGIYPKDIAYVRLKLINPQTGMLIRTFYFQFKKSYQMSLDSRHYITDPVLGTKIIKNGILTELKRFKTKEEKIVYKKAKTTFKQMKIKDLSTGGKKEEVQVNAITRTMTRYSEKPKMIFLVTPPHLSKYAKLILILIKQLVDLNFDQSYMSKSDQKPLYKTRFMLDELGNLQSEGHGIQGFETMLSIGLGQEQQFTIILQTLQQLRDVYGDSVDKIVQGNTSNIVFLKSTDDSMLDTLQKMSGTTHKSFTDSKTITKDMENVLLQVDGKVSYTMTTREVPVISYNDLAFIPERNSIVFRAGNSPIWNRNETILPMSWRLFQNTITQPGKEYSLQTIPTLSSAIDFDVRKNQPDYSKMLDKRMKQATSSDIALDAYRNVYDYSDFDIEQLDPDVYADEVMGAINTLIREEAGADDVEVLEFEYDEDEIWSQMAEENTEQLTINAQYQKQMDSVSKKRFAGGLLAPDDLVSKVEGVTHNYDREIINAYRKAKGAMQQDRRYFSTQNGNLHGTNGTPYILQNDPSDDLQALNQAAQSEDSGVYSEGDVAEDELSALNKYIVTDEFYRFLAGCDTWSFANNKFEQEMKRQMSE